MASEESDGPGGFVSVSLIHDPKDASGASITCADIFLIAGPDPDSRSIWTEPESGTFWPKDLLPEDPELTNLCRVWILKMCDVDPGLRAFQDCIYLQKFAAGTLNAIDQSIGSCHTTSVATGEEANGRDEKRPNNGVIILIGHGLGGILAQAASSLVLELSTEMLRGHHLRLKQAHWRLVLLGTPNLHDPSKVIVDYDQILGIVAYYGGKGFDVNHTRQFWMGLQQHSMCLINNNWVEQGLSSPTEPHGTVRVACFREGEEDQSLAQNMKSLRPNDPEANGFVVQRNYSFFGGQALSGFSMVDPPSPVIPKKHKNMGQIKDKTEPSYLGLQAILKEFVKLE